MECLQVCAGLLGSRVSLRAGAFTAVHYSSVVLRNGVRWVDGWGCRSFVQRTVWGGKQRGGGRIDPPPPSPPPLSLEMYVVDCT